MEVATDPTQLRRYSEYKKVETKWVDEAPTFWEILPLFAIAKIKSVSGMPERELLSVYLERGVVRFSDVDEKRTNATSLDLSKYQVVEPGDLVLNNQQAWRGSVGVSKLSGIVSPAYIVLELNDRLDPEFANYLFRDGLLVSSYLICSKGVGTIQRNLYWPQLRRVNILVPPRTEQTAIARFLDCKTAQIDKAIAQKEKLIELLKERRQILIHNALTQGLNPSVAFKHSGIDSLGKIPKHWKIKRIKYLLAERNERSENGSEPLFMVSQEYGLVPRSEYHEKAEVAQTAVGNKRVYINDLVFNKLKAHLGVFFKSNIPYVGIVSPDYAVYSPIAEIEDLKYLELLFRHPVYIGQFICNATGIVEGLIRLYSSDLFRIKVPVPPIEEQKDILEFVNARASQTDQLINNQEHQIKRLKEYKSTLINSAVTGKIKVPDLETMDQKSKGIPDTEPREGSSRTK